MVTERSILDYQQECFSKYNDDIGLPQPYVYPTGNPIRPLPPIQTTCNGLMIVGAYPSARFESRRSANNQYRLIPIGDNLQPFGAEQYFDGQRVRILESGSGLKEYLLNPIGKIMEDCWITDLVKVFLYKPDHLDSCGAVVPDFKPVQLRSQFKLLAQRSLAWLKKECDLCQPELVVTLGEEVAQVISGELTKTADDLLSRPIAKLDATSGYPTLFLPHPDACRRNDKWRNKMTERTQIIKDYLQK
jgi:uracil-DNA glycosylase